MGENTLKIYQELNFDYVHRRVSFWPAWVTNMGKWKYLHRIASMSYSSCLDCEIYVQLLYAAYVNSTVFLRPPMLGEDKVNCKSFLLILVYSQIVKLRQKIKFNDMGFQHAGLCDFYS